MRFRRGQQYLWRTHALSGLPVRRRVARPRFDTNVELHFRNGREQIALNINGQGLERGNIKGVKPLGNCSEQVRQYRQKTRKRLACDRGGDKQSMLYGLRCRKHVHWIDRKSTRMNSSN